VFVSINGVEQYLWRAVDQDGTVLDIRVQARRDKQAATKFLRTLLKGFTYVPRVVITDKLASYGAAMREVLPSVEHRRHRLTATAYRETRHERFATWQAVTGTPALA
jgi:putative transposase